ncbi:hypothetical protein FSP39_010970 [Pinctada imbricata]|uniref:SRCR domain-containing protein n=1 Tax=Pinctada imbricata TaxID=66713 RepID=A0AA88YEL7_PINIB|nr:hypothetical protein FSP39_010970 [Pinctada imbricata]
MMKLSKVKEVGRTRYNTFGIFFLMCFGSEPRFLQLDRPRPYRTRTNKRTKFLSLKCPKDAHASLRQCTFWCKSMSDTAAGRLTCTKRSDKVKDVAKRIRLRGYNRTDKGRVEVFHKGVWGFVYPQWIQFHEADMFCRMLGFKYGGEPIFDDSMPTTRSTLWIRYIDCPVNATTLTDCILSWEGGTYFFDRAEGGGVTCRKTPKEVPVMPFRNRLNDRGIEKLQYYKDGYWGTVCGAYIGTPEASMVCSMMGLKHGGHFKKTVQDYYLKAIGPVLLRNLDCPLNSTDFSQCQFRNNSFLSRHTACGKYSNYRKDVSLICNKNPPRNIAIRLNGSKRNKGFLEVSNEGKWKIVSYASNPALASVVCRQLGFRHGGEMYISDLCKTRNCTGADSFSAYEVMDTLNENLEGQVTLKRNDSFYSVSATLWDDIHARAHCKSLGHRDGKPLILNNANRVSFYNFTMYNNRQTIQRMYCGRESQDLYDCFHTGWNQRLQGESSLLSFVSNAIAGVKCSK